MNVANSQLPLSSPTDQPAIRARLGRALAGVLLSTAAAAGPLIRRGSSDRLGHHARLMTGPQGPYVAKRATTPEERKGVWMEVRMLPAVRRYTGAEVIVPRLLHVTEASDELEIDLEWLAGYHSRVSLARCARGVDWLAHLPLAAFADLPELDAATLLDQAELDLFTLSGDPLWRQRGPLPEDLLDRLRQHAFALAAFPTVVVHNDYRPGNVLVRGEAIALIDWAAPARGCMLLDWLHLGITHIEWLPAIWRELERRVADDPARAAALPHAGWFCAVVAACHTAAHAMQRPRGLTLAPRGAVLRLLLAREPRLAQG
jgi:hypothetical protein